MYYFLVQIFLGFCFSQQNVTGIEIDSNAYLQISGYQNQIYVIDDTTMNNIYQYNLLTDLQVNTINIASDILVPIGVNSLNVYVGSYSTPHHVYKLSHSLQQQAVVQDSYAITALFVNEVYLIAGTTFGLQRLTLSSMSLVQELSLGRVYGLYVYNQSVFVSYQNTFRVEERDLNDMNTLQNTFTGHTADIYTITIQYPYLFSAGNDQTIIYWNLNNPSFNKTLTGHSASIHALVASQNYLFSGGWDGYWIQWQIDSGAMIRMVSPAAGQNVNGLYVYQSTLVVCGDGGLWKYTIPELVTATTTTTTTTTIRTTTTSAASGTNGNYEPMTTTMATQSMTDTTTMPTTTSSQSFQQNQSVSVSTITTAIITTTVTNQNSPTQKPNAGHALELNIFIFLGMFSFYVYFL